MKKELAKVMAIEEQDFSDNLNERLNSIEVKSQKAQQMNDSRHTFVIDHRLVEQLKDIAYWRRIKIKDALKEALEMYFESQKNIKK